MQTYRFEELQAALAESLAACRAMVTAGGADIVSLLATSRSVIGTAPAAPAWLEYVQFAASIVQEGLAAMVLASLQHLAALLEPKGATERTALLWLELQLHAPEICWAPQLSGPASVSVRAAFATWQAGLLEAAALMPPLDPSAGTIVILRLNFEHSPSVASIG